MQSRTGLLEVTHEPNYLWNGHGVWQPEEGLELTCGHKGGVRSAVGSAVVSTGASWGGRRRAQAEGVEGRRGERHVRWAS